MKGLLLAMVLAVAFASSVAAQHARLFKPENLGQLEGPDRDAYQRPDQIMDALRIGENSVVADLGAGGGWFTVRLARRVANGRVYAEDIQPEMIQAIERRVQREGLQKRVKTVLGTPTDPRIPEPLDAVLIVDTYHEIDQPVALLKNIAKSLKPTGVIGIVNYKKDEGGGPGPAVEERVDPEQVIRDATAAGLQLRKRETFLRYQYLLTFVVAPK
jgi:predicted methyltransferase